MSELSKDKGQQDYEDFVRILVNLEKEINENDRQNGITKKFKLTDIFQRRTGKNGLIHELMISKIKSYGKSVEELAPLVKAVQNSRLGQWMYQPNREDLLNIKIDSNINPLHSAEMTIYKYLGLYYQKYFKIENGKIVGTNINIFNYNNPGQIEDNLILRANYLPMLLTKDGKAFVSVDYHKHLIEWLTAMGVDIRELVRISINHSANKMNISSAGIYEYIEEIEGEKDIAISQIQANAIAKIYGICKHKWAKVNSVNNMVSLSDLFGNGKSVELTENNMKNLKRLEYAFEETGRDFSVADYKKFLRNNQHLQLD